MSIFTTHPGRAMLNGPERWWWCALRGSHGDPVRHAIEVSHAR